MIHARGGRGVIVGPGTGGEVDLGPAFPRRSLASPGLVDDPLSGWWVYLTGDRAALLREARRRSHHATLALRPVKPRGGRKTLAERKKFTGGTRLGSSFICHRIPAGRMRYHQPPLPGSYNFGAGVQVGVFEQKFTPRGGHRTAPPAYLHPHLATRRPPDVGCGASHHGLLTAAVLFSTMLGICPESIPELAEAPCTDDPTLAPGTTYVEALRDLVTKLAPGSILLVELEWARGEFSWPIDMTIGIHHVLSWARQREILVVLPAGNGGNSLNGRGFEAARGGGWSTAASLLVGAADTSTRHVQWSNKGGEVRAHGPESGIRSLPERGSMYAGNYGNTSGAAAVVAGACALAQAAVIREFSRPMAPHHVVEALLATAHHPVDGVGVRPCLEQFEAWLNNQNRAGMQPKLI